MTDLTNVDIYRQLSIKQIKAIGFIVEGYTDEDVAARVDVSRQTINYWKNHDATFTAALNNKRKLLL